LGLKLVVFFPNDLDEFLLIRKEEELRLEAWLLDAGEKLSSSSSPTLS